MERCHSRGHHLCKVMGNKESVYIRKEFNSHRTGLGHKHGRRFIVLEHQARFSIDDGEGSENVSLKMN